MCPTLEADGCFAIGALWKQHAASTSVGAAAGGSATPDEKRREIQRESGGAFGVFAFFAFATAGVFA